MDLQEHLEQALELDRRGEIDAALACLEDTDGHIPDNAAHLKLVGQLYQRLGADGKSLRHLARALELDPGDADLHMSLGFHYMDNGDPVAALDYFQSHLELLPDSHGGQVYLGRVLDFLGRPAEAEAALRAALALAPEDLDTHHQLGRVCLRRGDIGAAIAVFEDAKRLGPDSVLAEIGLARCRALAGMPPPEAARPEAAPASVVCVKHGDKYGAEYVNRLYSMVARNCTSLPRFVCFTENAGGLAPGIEVQPLPGDGLAGWWNKVALFRRDLPGVSGRLLYLDLDVVITGNLDPLLSHPGQFVIMDNDYVPGFNSSVMLFEAGARPEIFDDFGDRDRTRLDGDQDWIALKVPDAELWPHLWCVPYRLRAAIAPPDETKVVVFSGRPNPGDYPAPWVKDYWQ
ncbi:MAG: tetratricopeptide repeat protein [Rhodospirillales bacterium]|jgi:tetratricopeptide (TPR) repeat protein